MSEQQNVNNDSAGLTSMPISDYGEMKADNKLESEIRDATAHHVQQAIYDYRDASHAYGGSRGVHAHRRAHKHMNHNS